MNFVLLGAGKTGSIVAEVARERGHTLTIIGAGENKDGKALTAERLADVDAVIDFTNPHAVIHNIEAAVKAHANLVVGTTGWYDEIPAMKKLVEEAGTGFVWASNFSIGVNLFFHILHTASSAMKYGYEPQIHERHHAEKKDSPSGTAVVMQKIIADASGVEVPMVSEREGDVVGYHELTLDSVADTIKVSHDAKNRRGFAEGAVRAAEWVAGKKGFYNFRNIFSHL